MRPVHEDEPTGHSFDAGNVVRLSKRFPTRKTASGPYKVVAQLPERDGQFQYRIKSSCEAFYRTVAESDLELDGAATVSSDLIAGQTGLGPAFKQRA